ncbi:NADH-quinone oxidoreductase subunit C [Winogradskya consettensis]|uniref:Dehydrogenase n=1 Tax=Winogradskya consettensis TaxID=113560 RepID=A0A919SBG2_9ACTN|nr:NADH-quinone oxidoreductase subunit C [Actinoplanes consettensis]GIM67396.1 dehydrogenase [Actinoplanes consettensis]
MTPEEVGERMVALLTADNTDAPVDPSAFTASVSGGGAYARAVVDVPAALWWTALDAARDQGGLGCDFFDWLSAVDEESEGFTVVAHLWSTRRKHGVLIRARVPRDTPAIESVTDLFPGASWHERETHEMFGIAFTRHPDLSPLLLPPGFQGHPMRKEFILASRVAKSWPGAKEPGESESGTAKRAPIRPPGVPDPNDWGPLKGKVPPPETPTRPARRAPTDRPARPAPTDRPAPPVATDGSARPVASDGSARPVAGDGPARPAPGDRTAPPVVGDRPARPAAGDRPAGPASADRSGPPVAGEHRVGPGSGARPPGSAPGEPGPAASPVEPGPAASLVESGPAVSSVESGPAVSPVEPGSAASSAEVEGEG